MQDAAYFRAWRATHPEYRAREVERARKRRALHGRGDRSAEYRRRTQARHLAREQEAAAWHLGHPLLEEARAIASRLVRRDWRTTLTDGRWEDAVGEAALALVAGLDAERVVRDYLARERKYTATHLPLLMEP